MAGSPRFIAKALSSTVGVMLFTEIKCSDGLIYCLQHPTLFSVGVMGAGDGG